MIFWDWIPSLSTRSVLSSSVSTSRTFVIIARVLVSAILLPLISCNEPKTHYSDPTGEYTKLKDFPDVWQLIRYDANGIEDSKSECRFRVADSDGGFNSSLKCLIETGTANNVIWGDLHGQDIDFVMGAGTQDTRFFTGKVSENFDHMEGEYLSYPGYPVRRWEARPVS